MAQTRGSGSLKATVLDAALKILYEEGLHLGADSISYAKVFAYIEQQTGIRVTRGSVHERIWASHDDFRREVLAAAVSRFPEDYVIGGGNALALIEAQADRGLTSNEMSDLFARRMIPIIVESSFTSPAFLHVQSIKAAVSRTNDPVVSGEVAEVMLQRSMDRMDNRRSGMTMILRAMGVESRSDLGLTTERLSDLFFMSTWALVVGAFLNARSGCDAALEEIDGDLGGRPDDQPWLVLSVGMRALMQSLSEPATSPPDPAAIRGMASVSNALSAGEHVRPGATIQPGELAITGPPTRRRSRGELKELVLSAGVQVLMQGDLHLRPETLSYADVFSRVKADTGHTVNRASVHKRFWDSHEEFCLDVLTTSLKEEQLPDLQLEDLPPLSSTPQHQAAVDALRCVTLAAVEAMKSPELIRRTLIKTSLIELDESEADDRLRRQVRINENASVQAYADLLQSAVLDRGFEVRSTLGLSESSALRTFAVLFHTLVNGVAFEKMSSVLGDVPTANFPRLDGSADPKPWSVAEVAAWAIFDHLYRPIQR